MTIGRRVLLLHPGRTYRQARLVLVIFACMTAAFALLPVAPSDLFTKLGIVGVTGFATMLLAIGFLYVRADFAFEVDGEGVSFRRGSSIRAQLPWSAVKGVQYGTSKWPVGSRKGAVAPYIFVTGLNGKSIRVATVFYLASRDEAYDIVQMAATLASQHGIPTAQRDFAG